MRTAADKWMDHGTCARYCDGIDANDAIDAAERDRGRSPGDIESLRRFSADTLLAAFRVLATCLENECPVHGDWGDVRTRLLSALGDADE